MYLQANNEGAAEEYIIPVKIRGAVL